METVKADAITYFETFDFVTAPWKYVRGNKELADWKASDRTAIVVVVENNVSEVVPASALFGVSDGFRFAGGHTRNLANTGAGNDFGSFGIRIYKKGIEVFLAERDDFGGVLVKLIPNSAVKVTGSSESFDAAKFERGVKGGEVAQLHRHGARRMSDPIGQINDHRLPMVELIKAELVIEIKNDEELLPGPAAHCWHVIMIKCESPFRGELEVVGQKISDS